MQLRTEVEIDAPAASVWDVLTDFKAYHEWNPFITSVAGKLAVGETLEVKLATTDGKEFTFKPSVLVVEPARELRWRGKLWVKGLFDGEHFFQLSDAPGGGTRLLHGEDFGGILLKLMGNVLTDTARGFVGMNQALKRRVERPASR